MRNKTIKILFLCVVFTLCSVVSNPVMNIERIRTKETRNETEAMQIPSYERSIEFLIPKNNTRKIISSNTLDTKKLNDTLKDDVLNEKEAMKKGKIDERSFIFIEQRYKVPVHHRHSLQHPHGNVQNYKTFISNHNEDLIDNTQFSDTEPRLMIDDFSPRLEYKMQPALAAKSYYLDKINSYQPRRPLDNKSDNIKEKVQIANAIIRNQYQKMTDTKSRTKSLTAESTGKQHYHPLNIRHKTKTKQDNASDDHREYVELLKPPLVRAGANYDSNLTRNNGIDDGVYEDNAVPKLSSKPYSNYGFIRPFAISNRGNDFQFEHDDDSDERLQSDDVISALRSTDDKTVEGILKAPIEGNVIDGKQSSQQLLTQLCNNNPRKTNPECKCAKVAEISVKPNGEKNEKSTLETASENYKLTSPLRLIRGPEPDVNNNTASTEKNSRSQN